jgi:CheY-like chemotaxis protein/HPt (histidine-containing phosphotransfer) domain-containing protein
MSFRILHIDDDPDIREIVKFSLGLHPIFEVVSCARGEDALTISAAHEPDLILCDVMMPGMDGPALLARLRDNPITAQIPVVFMTARAQTQDLEQFKILGAAGVITKPFDPMKIADIVRDYLTAAKLGAADDEFARRLRSDASVLATFREQLQGDPHSSVILENLQSRAHKLAGAAGVFNFQVISRTATSLEQALIERCAGRGTPGGVEAKLDAVLQSIRAEPLTALPTVNTREMRRRENCRIPAQDHAGGGDDESM